MSTTILTRPATEKQLSFLKRLVAERDLGPELDAVVEEHRALWREGKLTAEKTSRLIDVLLLAPKRPVVHADGETVGEGYYLLDGAVFKVRRSKTSGRLYASRLTIATDGPARASWDYDPGAMRSLAGSDRLTVEAAAKLGHLHGICVVCGRTLTDPESVTRGIGPVCAANL